MTRKAAPDIASLVGKRVQEPVAGFVCCMGPTRPQEYAAGQARQSCELHLYRADGRTLMLSSRILIKQGARGAHICMAGGLVAHMHIWL